MAHPSRFSKPAAVVLTLVALTFSGGVPGVFASTDESAPPKAQTYSVHLNADQAAALRSAYSQHKSLTLSEARQVIDSVGKPVGFNLIKSASAGYASSAGTCSYITLYGLSWGYYHFHQSIDAMWPAEFGEISISTNGVAASSDDHWFGYGWSQDYVGVLGFTGIGAWGTTMSGWMVLENNDFCAGALFAQW